jgi:hypothetical protein
MTKNIGMLLLAIYLILVGITTLFHVAIGSIVMGIFGAGDRHFDFSRQVVNRLEPAKEKPTAHMRCRLQVLDRELTVLRRLPRSARRQC